LQGKFVLALILQESSKDLTGFTNLSGLELLAYKESQNKFAAGVNWTMNGSLADDLYIG
jgi:hypothetical protein